MLDQGAIGTSRTVSGLVDGLHPMPMQGTMRRAAVLMASVVIGAVAPFLMPVDLSRQYQVEARLEILSRAADPAAANALLQRANAGLYAPAVLDALATRMQGIGAPGFAGNRPTTLGFLSDIVTRREMTVGAQEVAARNRLSPMLAISHPQGSNLLVVRATAGDANTAAILANLAADLVARAVQDTAIAGETAAVETARKGLDQAQAAFDQQDVAPSELEKFQALQDARTQMEAEEARLAASMAVNAKRVEALAGLTVADVLAKPLPAALEGQGLDSLRQRHLDAALQVDRLSADLGPLHPRLVVAKGALEEARSAIGAALQRLSSAYKQRAQDLDAQLSPLKARRLSLDGTPVSQAALQREKLQAELASARKTYLDAMRASDAMPAVKPAELRPEGGADPQLAVASGLPMWLYALMGALTGLCLTGALMPSARAREDELEDEALPVALAKLPVTPVVRAEPAVAMAPSVTIIAADTAPAPVSVPVAVQMSRKLPVQPPMPSLDDYSRQEQSFADAVAEELSDRALDQETWPEPDNDDETHRLLQVLMAYRQPEATNVPLPHLLAAIMSRETEHSEELERLRQEQEAEAQIQSLRREIAALRQQVLDYRQPNWPEREERRTA